MILSSCRAASLLWCHNVLSLDQFPHAAVLSKAKPVGHVLCRVVEAGFADLCQRVYGEACQRLGIALPQVGDGTASVLTAICTAVRSGVGWSR